SAVEQARNLVETVVKTTEGSAKLVSHDGQNSPDIIDDAVFLRAGLKGIQRMAFEWQEDVGVSAGKLNKITKRLCLASEAYVENERSILETAEKLVEKYPGYREETYYQAARTLLSFAG